MPSPTSRGKVTTNYAGFWRRFLAYFVDFAILFPIGLAVQSMFGGDPFAVFKLETVQQIQNAQKATSSSTAQLVSLVLGCVYYLFMWVANDGATPGKKMMGIKIVRTDGSRLSYPIAFLRYIGMILSGVIFGLGFLWVAFDKKKQGWHDKIAGTIVVKTKESPKTLLALLITLITLALFLTYTGAVFMHGFNTALKEGKTSNSIQEQMNSMSPTAKVHYDKTQELFQKLNATTDMDTRTALGDEVIAEAKKATEADPQNAYLWTNLGNAHTWPSTTGSLEEGLEAYKKAEELDPNNVVYINNVGDMMNRMEMYEQAVIQFQKALRLTDNSGYAHLSIGKSYKALNINDEAQKHFTRAIEVFKSQNATGDYDDNILEAQKELGSLPK